MILLKIIGLSGGIASGKSTITNALREMNIPVIDGDEITHDIMQNGSPALLQLVEVFGSEVINNDGSLNRKKLGSLAFGNKRNMEKLNSITHPFIKEEILRQINTYKEAGKKCCVVDGALLMEGIFKDIVDTLILVFLDKDIQIKRLMARNIIGYDEALIRINSQMPFEEKRKYADYIINNSYDVEYTLNQLNRIINEILKVEDMND